MLDVDLRDFFRHRDGRSKFIGKVDPIPIARGYGRAAMRHKISRSPVPFNCGRSPIEVAAQVGIQLMQIHLAAILTVALELTGSAVLAADADHGADLAKRWCATCHGVSDDQKQAIADVPPFAAVARRSDFSPEKLAFFLLDPHPKMPNFPLNRTEAADIAAYIASLRR